MARRSTRRTRSTRSTRNRRQRGGGVQTSQQWFDPAAYPPSAGGLLGGGAALSTAPTADAVRPVLASTFQAVGGGGRSRRQRGGGGQTSQQWFDPAVYPPSAGLLGGGAALSTAPTADAVRPVLLSTFPGGNGQMGGGKTRRGKRSMSGGFSPSIMGGFVANAQAVAVPLVLYLAYHTMVPKKGGHAAGSRRTRRRSHPTKK
jgi:hypothetical protein